MSHLIYTLPFSKIKMSDILQVGGKNASLGEMIQNLKPLGVEVPELTKSIEKLIEWYENEEAFFVKRLSYGIAKIAAAFYPNKVIVRFSDFKSNEYFNMLGGKYFEPS